MTARRAMWWAIAGGLALILLWYSLRGIDWRRVWAVVSHADPVRLAAAGVIATATLFLRACRWRVLLNAEGNVTVPTAFWATAAGYFGNNFLPARAGELVRTYYIRSAARLKYAYILGTALAERATDALVLAGVALTVLLTGAVRPDWLSAAAKPIAAVAIAAAIGIALLPFLAPLVERAVAYLPLRADWRRHLADAIHHALSGLRTFHHPYRLCAFFALTAIIWTGDAASTVVAAASLGLPIGFPAAFLLLASLGLASALPSTPGYVGIFQFVAVTVLVPYGLSRSDAIAYILTAQALSYAIVAVWGAIAFARYRALRRDV